ncbi:DUF1194 domain-containing protein [uncultured Roseobacter sp.]|uniref:DUF1194 domain-containing protein n=1 Tax=uncultured Roseobacter sp. TaxID=114847 RepID=UPI00260F1253|nr:DUF1194 domain-containing protein [uncultured Roseobacter sp.]
MKHFKQLLCGASVAAAMALPGQASATTVDVELMFMNDVSGSVTAADFNAQIAGYAAAFRDSTLIDRIQEGAIGKIAVSVAFMATDISISDWFLIEDAASGEAFATAVEGFVRPGGLGIQDNVAGLLDDASDAFKTNAFDGTRNVIDIVTEGAQSTGGCRFSEAICAPLQNARDAVLADNIDAINAMVLTDPSFFGPGAGFRIDSIAYAENNIIGGDGSFVVATPDFTDFAPAIRNKIEREIVGPDPDGQIPLPAAGWMMIAGFGALAGIGRRKRAKS